MQVDSQNKSHIALLGGAFDPPTLGHLAIARFVLDSNVCDEVFLMPCFRHLYGKQMADSQHRLAMCRIASRNDSRIKVFDYEIKHELCGSTYDLCTKLLQDDFAKNCTFSIVIGMDNANGFARWFNYARLKRMVSFVVVPRTGETPDPNVTWYLNPPHTLLHPDKPLPDISSTAVRDVVRQIAKGEQPHTALHNCSLADDAVVDYIQEHGLYGFHK